MIHAGKGILPVMLAVFCIAPVRAGEGDEPPKLTPEQQAEMEAYQKAGTPGSRTRRWQAPRETMTSI